MQHRRRKNRQCNISAGIIEDEEMLIIAADRSISNSDMVREMLENTPAFSGISDAVDLFQAPSCSIVSDGSAVNSCATQNIREELTINESPEIGIRIQGSRKRKRSACDTSIAADPPRTDNNEHSPSAKRSTASTVGCVLCITKIDRRTERIPSVEEKETRELIGMYINIFR